MSSSALGSVDLFRLLSIWPYCSGGGLALPSRHPIYVVHMTFSSGRIQRGEGGKTQPPMAPGLGRMQQATYLAGVRKCWIILEQWWRGEAALQLGWKSNREGDGPRYSNPNALPPGRMAVLVLLGVIYLCLFRIMSVRGNIKQCRPLWSRVRNPCFCLP